MMKLIWLVLWLVSISWGQGTNTIFQTLSSNVNGNSVTGNIRNIGQAYHLATVLLRDNVPNVCASREGDVTFEGSHNNTVFFTIVQSSIGVVIPTGVAAYKFVKNIEGYGSYPYIRIRVQNTDNVNCRYDVVYSGNINSPPRSIQKVDPIAITSPGALSYVELAPNAIGVNLGLTAVNGGKIVIYGLEITNVTVGQDIVIQTTNGGGTTPIKTLTGMAAGFNQLLPIQDSPWYVGLISGTIDFVLTNNTTVYVGIWYLVQ